MKYLSSIAVAAFGLVLGFLAAAAVHNTHPSLPVQDLLAERNKLQADLLQHMDAPAALPMHQQWQKLKQYISLYPQLSLASADGEATTAEDEADHSRLRWQGVLAGPTKDIILVSRSLQTIAAVRFERLSIEQGQASLVLSLVGGPT